MNLSSSRRNKRCSWAVKSAASAMEDSVSKVEAEDSWISKALAIQNSALSGSSVDLQSVATGLLSSARVPTAKQEAWRFTDLLSLIKTSLEAPAAQASDEVVNDYVFKEAEHSRVVMVDGVYSASLSDCSGLGKGVSVGPLSLMTEKENISMGPLGSQTMEAGSVFAQLNAACGGDVMVVRVEAGERSQAPVHVLYLSSSSQTPGGRAVSHPRLLIQVGEDAHVEVVEEFGPLKSGGAGQYFCNSVAEVEMGVGAGVTHSVLQRQEAGAVHVQATFVKQAERSAYSLNDVALGAELGRHDVTIKQEGPCTDTNMAHFQLAGRGQVLDAHTSLQLDYPNSTSNQLHKCIVSESSGRGVFDGNVKVNKLAQKTDAKQLSRNLLLAPRATVHLKPNLQIIADDVKCTHGCTVSDLEEEELFYFQARGIDAAAARSMLVFSFCQEVIQGVPYQDLRARIESQVKATLEESMK